MNSDDHKSVSTSIFHALFSLFCNALLALKFVVFSDSLFQNTIMTFRCNVIIICHWYLVFGDCIELCTNIKNKNIKLDTLFVFHQSVYFFRNNNLVQVCSKAKVLKQFFLITKSTQLFLLQFSTSCLICYYMYFFYFFFFIFTLLISLKNFNSSLSVYFHIINCN